MPYSEIESVNKFLPGITIKQYGLGCFIVNQPTEKDINAARYGLSEVSKIISSGDYELVILDEACIAVHYNLFSVNDLISVLTSRPAGTEIVVTGRYASPELMEIADLVTEMKEIKHYYNQGVQARKGIEF